MRTITLSDRQHGRAAREIVPKLAEPRASHAADEIARHFVDCQSEEVLDLRAGDQDRDPVGEADDRRDEE